MRTYKIMETVYRNGCEYGSVQLFDDTADFERALEWFEEAIGEDFDFSELPYPSINAYEVWYEIEVYDNDEYCNSAMIEIFKHEK